MAIEKKTGMLTVYKYPMKVGDVVEVLLPKGAVPLYVNEQRGENFLWCLVDPSQPKEIRRFRWAGTGHPIRTPAERLVHVGSWMMGGGSLVFHLFEIK